MERLLDRRKSSPQFHAPSTGPNSSPAGTFDGSIIVLITMAFFVAVTPFDAYKGTPDPGSSPEKRSPILRDWLCYATYRAVRATRPTRLFPPSPKPSPKSTVRTLFSTSPDHVDASLSENRHRGRTTEVNPVGNVQIMSPPFIVSNIFRGEGSPLRFPSSFLARCEIEISNLRQRPSEIIATVWMRNGNLTPFFFLVTSPAPSRRVDFRACLASTVRCHRPRTLRGLANATESAPAESVHAAADLFRQPYHH